MKKGYISNIERLTLENKNFRKVAYTTNNSQVVLMSLDPGEEIGSEVHGVDQFFRIEKGQGEAVLNGDQKHALKDGTALVVPAGTEHNIINASKTEPLKLYTVYAPPHHRDGTIHKTKADAEADTEDEFKGDTTE